MSTATNGNNASSQGDLMLWVAGGVIAAVGVAWLVILRPWGSGDSQSAVATTPQPTIMVATAAGAPPAQDPTASWQDSGQVDAGLDNPLRMAKLAYDAGMLVEPTEYSAWTLYAKVL